jgi:phage/plasmid-like protein (TIGR03299 family)
MTQADTQFSERQVPWMKLGKIVDGTKTAKEAAKLGGLDFTVQTVPLTYEFDLKIHTVPNRMALIRDDNGKQLGIVSANVYQPLQYADAFDFMDTIDSQYVAAGALKGGRQGFMVVKVPMALNVLDGTDPHDLYGVLRTSHDLTRATEIMVMPLRGRCMNQLVLHSFAKNAPYRWSIKHTKTQAAKLAEAKDSLERLMNYGARFEELVKQLVDIKVTEDSSRRILSHVLPQRPKTAAVIDSIEQLRTTSPEVGFVGTGWGLVNAVSEHFDWQRSGGTPESRFLGVLEGQTAKAINRTSSLLIRGVGV